jgi:hypothetical protein
VGTTSDEPITRVPLIGNAIERPGLLARRECLRFQGMARGETAGPGVRKRQWYKSETK